MDRMTAFTSTAEFYSRFRIPYPKSLVARLKVDAGLDYESEVLDLATGPGRLALALAPSLRGNRGGGCRSLRCSKRGGVWLVSRVSPMSNGFVRGRKRSCDCAGLLGPRHDRRGVPPARPGRRAAAYSAMAQGGRVRGDRWVLRRFGWRLRLAGVAASGGVWMDAGETRRPVRPAKGKGPRHRSGLSNPASYDVTNREFAEPHTWTREGISGSPAFDLPVLLGGVG